MCELTYAMAHITQSDCLTIALCTTIPNMTMGNIF